MRITDTVFKNRFLNIKNTKNIKKTNNTTPNNTNKVEFCSLFNYYNPLKANRHTLKNYTGCLLGGAIGDALGSPVEFMDINYIEKIYGPKGIAELMLDENNKAQISDDTQMTMFSADGLIKSLLKNPDENAMPDFNIIYNSYQNWYTTQCTYFSRRDKDQGWIADIKDLYSQRAPGTTCTSALLHGIKGSIEEPINFSKGCGGVMRTAPAGLVYYKDERLAFEVGARCAALTHGSSGAYLSAGVHSAIIAGIIQGKKLDEAIDASIDILKTYKGHIRLENLIEKAKYYAQSDIEPKEAIAKLGQGWHGDEAIAISIYCALKANNDFKKGIIMAVNHSGDSDSTGAITGNILGAYLGTDAIPSQWKKSVELSKEIKQIALDLYVKPKEIESPKERYGTMVNYSKSCS